MTIYILQWFDMWHFTFDIWHLTLICHDIKHRYAMTLNIYMQWHFTFAIWNFTFYIWHLIWLKVLAALALIIICTLSIAQYFTDGFCGYLSNLKKWGNSLDLCGLRDASASKKGQQRVICSNQWLVQKSKCQSVSELPFSKVTSWAVLDS